MSSRRRRCHEALAGANVNPIDVDAIVRRRGASRRPHRAYSAPASASRQRRRRRAHRGAALGACGAGTESARRVLGHAFGRLTTRTPPGGRRRAIGRTGAAGYVRRVRRRRVPCGGPVPARRAKSRSPASSSSSSATSRSTRAGLPTTTTRGGTSFVTTAPAPTNASSPISIPGRGPRRRRRVRRAGSSAP